MTLETFLLSFIETYQILIIFIGTFLFGDTVVLSLGLLSAKGTVSIPLIVIFGFLGTVISDSIWFFMADFIHNRKYVKDKLNKNKKALIALDKLTGRKPFLFLSFAKFLYGTRILFIVYLSIKKLKYTKFMIYNSIGTLIWLAVLILIGWLSGKGIINIIPKFMGAQYLLTAAVVLALIIKGITIWITKRVEE